MKNVGSGKAFANKSNSDSGRQASDEMGLADLAFAFELDDSLHFRGNSSPNSLNETLQNPNSSEKSSSSYSTSSSSLSEKSPLNSTSALDARKVQKERLSRSYP
ncbi:MAG: hypothetical protein ACO26G_04810 [Rickettsiales bacterium]